MILKIQFLTLGYSFIYGIFFSFLLTINYNFIYKSNKIAQWLITILFILINTLFYFFILKKINNGIIHPYFLFVFILGIIVEIYVPRLVAKHFKKWYNLNARW